MTAPERSDHLMMYGMVGGAMHVVVGALVMASFPVVPTVGFLVLGLLWLAGAVAGALLWRRTVWIPLLSSRLVAAAWMAVVVANR